MPLKVDHISDPSESHTGSLRIQILLKSNPYVVLKNVFESRSI
jgi:hypothetical protein